MVEHISIEVVYALPEQAHQLTLNVPKGTSARAAVLSAAPLLPEQACVASALLGVFGKRLPHPDDYLVREGDRIEIYRPLLIDPKEVRRKRAERGRTPSA